MPMFPPPSTKYAPSTATAITSTGTRVESMPSAVPLMMTGPAPLSAEAASFFVGK